MSSEKISNKDNGESGGNAVRIVVIFCLAALLGCIAFFVRTSEVGPLVSFADSVLIASLIPLSLSAFIFIYRHGGFDIFLFSFSRIFERARSGSSSDYSEFVKRERGLCGIALPLSVIGGVLFAASVVLAFL